MQTELNRPIDFVLAKQRDGVYTRGNLWFLQGHYAALDDNPQSMFQTYDQERLYKEKNVQNSTIVVLRIDMDNRPVLEHVLMYKDFVREVGQMALKEADERYDARLLAKAKQEIGYE